MNKKIKALLIVALIQFVVAGIFFIGSLLDPLVGIYFVGIYFLIIAPFFTYHYAINLTQDKKEKLPTKIFELNV